MKVYLLSAYPEPPENRHNFQAQWLRESAALDPFKIHELCDDPEAADLILFVENHPQHDPFFLTIARHPIWRRYAQKCFLYHDGDHAYPLLPGLYPSLLKPYQRPYRCAGGPYIARIEVNAAIAFTPLSECPRYLYSFVGSRNCRVRDELFRLSDPRGLISDTTGKNAWSLHYLERQTYTERFAAIMKDSAFVLCPRGIGPSTYRLFEAMESGRIPVILSDQWVAPDGPPWAECTLQVPEAQVGNLPAILAQITPARRQAMAAKARAVWEEWFSHPVMFHRMAEWCLAITRQRATKPRFDFSFPASVLHTPPRLLLRFTKLTLIFGLDRMRRR